MRQIIPSLKHHKRLSAEQKAVLEHEYASDPVWKTNRITAIATRLGLKRYKVYKWHWDHKKKE